MTSVNEEWKNDDRKKEEGDSQMDSIAQSATAGIVAALTATTILGLAKKICKCWGERQEVRYIRNVLIEGRTRVMKAKDTPRKDMALVISEDALRAGQYNNMISKLDAFLHNWVLYLSHGKRKDLFDALDWYHTDALNVKKRGKEIEFIELPVGRWPTTRMQRDAANRIFGKLQSLKWLKLEAY